YNRTMSLHTHKTPGQLPETWNRRVVFFANLLSLFYGNEMETHALREEVGTLETYGCRLVPIIDILFRERPNTLILERMPNRSLLEYFKNELDLSLPALKIFSRGDYIALGSDRAETHREKETLLHAINKTKAEWIDGYVTEPQLLKIAERANKTTVSTFPGSYLGNNKLLLHQYLEKTGLPVFDTYIAENTKAVKDGFEALRKIGYRTAVVKAPIGASGIGMIKCHSPNACQEIPDYLFHEGPCLVQGWIGPSLGDVDWVVSPSVQMFIKENDLILHDITEQILSKESIHEGNIAPPTFQEYRDLVGDILDQAEASGRWLHDQGYRGTASVDFHLAKRAGRLEVRICEVNARVTGCTYPSLLAQKLLPGGVWLMRNIRFSPPQIGSQLLKHLAQNKTLFKSGGVMGILPINLNPDHQGKIVKGQFLFLGGSHRAVFGLLKQICEDGGYNGDYDRD
ncbi:MAG: hypothetical protein ACE5GK_08110, partial [Nitrospiria bacterium]